MALALVPRPKNLFKDNEDWENIIENGDYIAKNIHSSISEQDTTVRPVLQQGSIIEFLETIVIAVANETLIDDDELIDGLVHIKLVPITENTVSAVLTSDALPEWDQTRNGWYNSEGHKFLEFFMTKTGTTYSNKGSYVNKNGETGLQYNGAIVGVDKLTGNIDFIDKLITSSLNVKGSLEVLGTGILSGSALAEGNVTSTEAITVQDLLFTTKGCKANIFLSPINGVNASILSIFNTLDPIIPNIGDNTALMLVHSGASMYYAVRETTTKINMYGVGEWSIDAPYSGTVFVYHFSV